MAEDANQPILVREILVAVDSSSHSRAALRAAATLAKLMEANIRGLFVHEEHWSQISNLPSVTSINELTGKAHVLKGKALEQEIDLLKQRLQRQLQQISKENRIPHSWETARGRVDEEILQAARKADLITIGTRGRSFYPGERLGSTARAIIRKADKPILVLKKGVDLGRTITTVFDASDESQTALRLALSLAQKNESTLSILILEEGQDTEGQRNQKLEKMVESASIPVSVTVLEHPDLPDFLNAVNRQQSGLLVTPKNQSFFKQRSLETTLGYLNCPVLMVT
ncbi:Nucleotide-binding universal stress protein, UspA family [Fodinibius roseus]|uniref:Nucleotide-binding universal stress protein, UspA family n=1 Tax=Fodinibius roseus TaxID=1194090 RepID=A0A1M5CKD9_9BACT|nr:universal stress protein [Fodinibius roseus]SHF55178.1 Nucleotide-binding universal stress protein, UspA family [Fodinibius roseus]